MPTCGIRISPQAASFPITTTAGSPKRVSVSNSKPFSPKAPSPAITTTCLSACAVLDAEGVRRPHAETAERTWIEPVPRSVDAKYARGRCDDVAPVADHDRARVEHA